MHIDRPSPPQYSFEAVPGFFVQDDEATNHRAFDHTKQNLGLIERSYPTDVPGETTPLWVRFVRHIDHLNQHAPHGVTYKLIYMYRHGEGVHNVEEDHYGSEAWDEYWSKLGGNGSTIWADALLTTRGEEQAAQAAVFLQSQYDKEHMPQPQKYYVSPLYRNLQTAEITFGNLNLPVERPFRPVVKELLRETINIHTCNRRRNRSVLQSAFPNLKFEKGFPEEDLLWSAEHWETDEEIDARSRRFLEDLFTNEEETVISLTTHWCTMISIMRVIGHRPFRLPHCVIMPVLVKCTDRMGEKEYRPALERQNSGVD